MGLAVMITKNRCVETMNYCLVVRELALVIMLKHNPSINQSITHIYSLHL
jgi:hypothetical protein